MRQDKSLWLHLSFNFSDNQWTFKPALAQFGMERNFQRAICHLPQQFLAVGSVNRDDWNRGLPMIIVQVRRAPNSGADAPMDIDARIDKNRPHSAFVLEIPDRRRPAKAIDNHNFAADIHIACRRKIKKVDAPAGRKIFDANRFAADAVRRRADRKRRGLGAVCLVPHRQRSLDRDA